MKTQKFEELCCSFCGKHARTVKKLITGPSVCICDECIGRCNRIISEEREKQGDKPVKPRDIPLPKRLRVLVSLESRFVEHLIAWREQTSAVLPGALQQAIKSLGESARGIRAESERWISEQAVPVTKEETVALCCSFCGLPRREVRELIAGPNTYICDECIGLCKDIIAEDSEQHVAKETPPEDVPVPKVLGRMVHAESHRAAELLTCRERNSGCFPSRCSKPSSTWVNRRERYGSRASDGLRSRWIQAFIDRGTRQHGRRRDGGREDGEAAQSKLLVSEAWRAVSEERERSSDGVTAAYSRLGLPSSAA